MIRELQSHFEIIALNTQLFLNCLDDIKDKSGLTRITGHSNSISFIGTHLVDARHFLGKYIGVDIENPVEEFVAGKKSIDDIKHLPTIDELRAAWREVTPPLIDRLDRLTWEDLEDESPHGFPVETPSVYAGIGFLLQHESYHIGQLGLLRKQLGYHAMTYVQGTGTVH